MPKNLYLSQNVSIDLFLYSIQWVLLQPFCTNTWSDVFSSSNACKTTMKIKWKLHLYTTHFIPNTLEKLFLEGTCEGRRGRGRPRRRWTQDIGEWMGVSTVEAGRQALERGEFRQAVWEAMSIKDPPQKKKIMYVLTKLLYIFFKEINDYLI